MIDHLLAFASESDAKADPIVGAYWHGDGQGGGSWDMSCCIPSLSVWAPSADVTTTTTINGQTYSLVTHTPYDSLWRINIALPSRSAALCALSSCHLVADRDLAAQGKPFLLQSVLTADELAALMIAPLFAGSSYPFGVPPA